MARIFRSQHLLALAILCAMPSAAFAEIKRVPYPEVSVDVAASIQPDAEFQAFWKTLSEAVKARNAAALFALVGPMFVWTSQGALVAEFDPGRDALHNFKVVFGFRAFGKDEDGGVESGPYWDELAQYANDPAFYSASDKTGMICGPLLAEVADTDVLEQAQNTVGNGDDFGSWFFVVGTPVARAPGDTGTPVGRLGKVAVPVIGQHPPAPSGAAAPQPTHYQVLMPSGAAGWVAAEVARPLNGNRLCYARTREGRWAIVNFDQGQDEN